MIILRKPYKPIEDKTNVVVADFLSGNLDGSNQLFKTTYKYKRDRITVHYNGQAMHCPYDFEQTGDDEIKFLFVMPLPDENVRATYELDGSLYGHVGMFSGSEPVAMGSISHTVSFSLPLSNDYFKLNVELVTTDGSPSVFSFVVGNKNMHGFTVFFSGVIDTPNYKLEWVVHP
jgi:hypothetical protein